MFPEIFRDEVFRLETRRLWLRWPVFQDASAMASLAGEKEVADWTAYIPHPYPADEATVFIQAARQANSEGRGLYFVVSQKNRPQTPIGMISVELSEASAELGYWLGRPYWSQGFMSEALGLLMEILWRTTSIKRLEASILPDNHRSLNLLQRIGFAAMGDIDRPAPGRNHTMRARHLALMRPLKKLCSGALACL